VRVEDGEGYLFGVCFNIRAGQLGIHPKHSGALWGIADHHGALWTEVRCGREPNSARVGSVRCEKSGALRIPVLYHSWLESKAAECCRMLENALDCSRMLTVSLLGYLAFCWLEILEPRKGVAGSDISDQM